MSRLQKVAFALVTAGTIVGIVAAVFTTWPGRVGLAVVVAVAWAVLIFSRREVQEVRSEGHAALMTATQRAYDALVAERSTNDKVVGLLRDRNNALTTTLVELRGELMVRQAELAERRMDVSRLRGDNASLRQDVSGLVDRVDQLSGQLDSLTVVDRDGNGAEIFALPRRPMKHQRTLWSDDDVWNSDDMPSVADLVRVDAQAHQPTVEALQA